MFLWVGICCLDYGVNILCEEEDGCIADKNIDNKSQFIAQQKSLVLFSQNVRAKPRCELNVDRYSFDHC